jgi:putative SOS response-associated peptidase YedK
LTTSANWVLEPIGDRMLVIVNREDWDEWFSVGELVEQSFTRITAPYIADEMSALAVSTLVK